MQYARIRRGQRITLVWQCSWSLGVPLYWRGADLAVSLSHEYIHGGRSLVRGSEGSFLAVVPIGDAPSERSNHRGDWYTKTCLQVAAYAAITAFTTFSG